MPCGNGTQRRDIICVQKTGNDFAVVPASECADLEKPAAVQQCEMGECEPQWFTTEWSAVRDEGTVSENAMLERQGKKKVTIDTAYTLLFSVLALVWKRLTDERGTVSNAGQKAQQRVPFETQT